MADRYVNYDKLLEARHRLGLDEMSKIHKVNVFNQIIDILPIADVEEVKHGYWRQNQYCKRVFYCSECNRHIEDATQIPQEHFPYCHCGAKMDEGNLS